MLEHGKSFQTPASVQVTCPASSWKMEAPHEAYNTRVVAKRQDRSQEFCSGWVILMESKPAGGVGGGCLWNTPERSGGFGSSMKILEAV